MRKCVEVHRIGPRLFYMLDGFPHLRRCSLFVGAIVQWLKDTCDTSLPQAVRLGLELGRGGACVPVLHPSRAWKAYALPAALLGEGPRAVGAATSSSHHPLADIY